MSGKPEQVEPVARPGRPRRPARPTQSVLASRAGYHHGNLRQAVLDAALELAQEKGPEGVSVREAARRLGVSPAAPFRHFPNRRALMTAAAEQASERLQIEVRKALARERGDALARLRSVGRGYLNWAQRHAAHFRIISARDQIDVAASPGLQHHVQAVRALTEDTLREAQTAGLVDAAHDPAALALLARATMYGLARMQLDGHFAQWDVAPNQEAAAMQRTLDLLLRLLQGRPAPIVRA